jgi:glyoxylase-like metal-dependent hydrolase (beta-lactamase superfamily II)
MSRYRTISLVIAFAVTMFGALAPSLRAQQFAPIMTHALNGGVYWIEGGVGSNSGVVIGKDGVIVIDAKQTPESGKAVMAEVAKLTSKPVTHIILTHSNLDHVDGLPGFPKGLTIIAQASCKQQMEHPRGSPQNIDISGYIPTKTVAKKESMTVDGVRFVLLHWAPAHTSGDLIIYLPDQKVAFTGDITVTRLPYPLIHLEDEGSSAGWIESMRGIVALNADTFVPGHGGTQTKPELQQRLANTAARREKIKELVAQGKSLADIKKELGEATPPAGSSPNFANFTEVVYKELTKAKS